MRFDLRELSDKKGSGFEAAKTSFLVQEQKKTLSKYVLNNKKKAAFYAELALFLDAHVPLSDALESIALTQQKPAMHAFFSTVVNRLQSGQRFYEILRLTAQASSYDWVAVKIGEETGNLSEVIGALGVYYRKKNAYRAKFISALLYPMIIFMTALLVLIFMLYVVVPMFEAIFIQNNVSLPLLTRGVLYLSSFVKAYGIFILFFLFGLFFVARMYKNHEGYRRFRDRMVIKLPVLGSFLKANHLTQCYQALALLLHAQINLLEALQLTREMIRFYPLETAIDTVAQQIMTGETLHKGMLKTGFFDQGTLAFIKAGETSHRLPLIFKRLFENNQEKLMQRSKQFTVALEPVLIVGIGVLVALILIAMYLPMFKLSTILS